MMADDWKSMVDVNFERGRVHTTFQLALAATKGYDARAFNRMNPEKKDKFMKHQLRLGERTQYKTAATALRVEFIRRQMLRKLDSDNPF